MPAAPWDARIAAWLIHPLSGTPVRPNHVTALTLGLGLVAASMVADGDRVLANVGAAVFLIAVMLDHADGALARLTGRTSAFGHLFDHVTAALNYGVMFVAIGFHLRGTDLGPAAIGLGLLAGTSIFIGVMLRLVMERQHGTEVLDQPTFAGFEIEDTLYLIGPITWFGALPGFLLLSAVGAPIFALVVIVQLLIHARRGAGGRS